MTNESPKNFVILDIGSHKLEEIQTLLSPFPRQFFIYLIWLVKLILKFLVKLDKNSIHLLKKQGRVIIFFFLCRRKYNVTIVSIEPNPEVVIPFLNKLSKKISICYVPVAILGHDSVKDFEIKTLYKYGNTLSHSLYKKSREMSLNQDSVCLSLKLGDLWNEILNLGLVSAESEIILRMNCEGAELGVIKECEQNRLKVKLLIGSIGDIQKIHGDKENTEAYKLMDKLGFQYYYFKGDDPSTWYDVIEPWNSFTSKYLV